VIRWDDDRRSMDCSVHDVLDAHMVSDGLALSSRARLRAGQEVHRAAQAAERYEAEVRIRAVEEVRGWSCTIHGRADGVERTDEHTIVEEIKSTALDADGLDGLDPHDGWVRQLRLYLYALGGRCIGRLRVVSLVDGSERLYTIPADPATRARVRTWLDERVLARERWLNRRDLRRAATVRGAFPELRPGQAEIVAAVEEAVRRGRHLMVQAPTGAGKTAAVLEGALRAAYATDRQVFWATSRNTQRWLVTDTLGRMRARGMPLRWVHLRSRATACLREGIDCRPEACRWAERFDEKVRDGELLERTLEADDAEAVGREAVACPYELATAAAAQADVVVGDVNYALDPDVYLRDCFSPSSARQWVLVVDEAHHLPDRAMGWLSPDIRRELADAAADRWAAQPAFLALAREVADAVDEAGLSVLAAGDDEALVEADVRRWVDLRDRVDELAFDHARQRAPGDEDPWLDLARAVDGYARALERAGEETVCLWRPGRLRLVCRDPSRVLGPRFAGLHASVAVSATLSPDWFWRDRCGLDADRVTSLRVPSPFPEEQRLVVVGRGVSTAFRHRERDGAAIADAIERVAAVVPGSIALFFGGFEVMDETLGRLTLPGRERRVQRPGMADDARRALVTGMAGAHVALCAVLGGAFGEGVDLPGGLLDAVVVVGPSLPPPSLEGALLAQWYDERFGDGFELASVLPGMTRVAQAAGRVVRGPADRGAVVLLCRRFQQHRFRRWLPEDWTVVASNRPWDAVARFFGGTTECTP
jgi:DNA excision repair protein ERCC-2